MKAKKKPLRIKHKIREERKRGERLGLAIIVAILIVIILVSAFLINSMLNQPSTSQPVSSSLEPKAAIVDHLSLTYPNQTFIETATTILEQAGYQVDYYPGEQVTVEFYRNIPTHNYGLIILRVHSTAAQETESGMAETSVTLFTSKIYSQTEYVYEQLTDQIVPVTYKSRETYYFGIKPEFITRSMKERFQDTIIVMMGCEGLRNTIMARTFIDKGAKVYISWNGAVLASYTDQATTHLLQHFLIEKRTLKEAVQQTFKDVGADPAYNSLLIYYPLEAGNYTIQNIASNLITNTAETQHKALYQKRKIDNL